MTNYQNYNLFLLDIKYNSKVAYSKSVRAKTPVCQMLCKIKGRFLHAVKIQLFNYPYLNIFGEFFELF